MMKRYDAERGDDTLTADIHDSVLGGIDLVVVVNASRFGSQVVHMSNHSTVEDAERELVELFPGLKWR